MKKINLLLVILLAFSACKNETTKTDYAKEKLDVTTSVYPEDISKVFKAMI